MSSRIARRVRNPLPYTGKLTIANVITDVTRLAGVEGDGATYPDSSAGVWPAATNIAAAVTITGVLGATVTNNSTEAPLFNGVSEKVVTPGAGLGEGGYNSILATGISGSTVYTVSEHVIAPLGATLRLRVTTFTAADAGLTSYDTTFVGTGARQVATVTFTSDATAAKYRILVQTITSNQAITFYMGNGGSGLQLETGSIATPFTPSSRSAAGITAPSAGVLSATQGWVFVRAKLGFANAYIGADDPRFFWWGVNDSRICLQPSTTGVSLISDTGPNDSIEQALTYVSGDYVSVLGAWTSGFAYVSRNGSARTSVARTAVPTIAQTTFGLGSDPSVSTRTLRGSILWAAIGKGTITDADAALFHAWGNNDPLPHMFPSSAKLTFLAHFNGDGTFYRRSA